MARASRPRLVLAGLGAAALLAVCFTTGRPPAASVPGPAAAGPGPYPMPPELAGVDLLRQTAAVAYAKSAGCLACHHGVRDPHFKDTLRIGCVDCHGGDANTADKAQAHVHPRFPDA